jgi:hypothetical protein
MAPKDSAGKLNRHSVAKPGAALPQNNKQLLDAVFYQVFIRSS